MSYEMNKADVYGLAHSLSAEIKEKGSELFFKHCPYCGGGSSKDKDTFSVNLETGAFKCFRSGCSKTGHFVEMARDFGYQLEFKDAKPKTYRRLPQRPLPVRGGAVEFMAKRGISREVTERYNITTQTSNPDILVFPFYDENNVLQFVKYRNAKHKKGNGPKEWTEKDTKPILFGMKQCEGFDRLIITEGQIDSLTLAECGIKNAVSVPIGCNGFTWIDNVWDWIAQFNEIIVFGDCEKGKITLLDTLQKRLPNKIKAVQTEDYLGEKDANDIFCKYGKQAIVTAVENAKVPPVNNVKELADVESVDIYNLPRIFTGIPEIDRIIGGLFFGQVILLTGRRGEGKSTFMSQLIVEALDQGHSVFAYSGELTDYHFKRWIDFQCAGPDNIVENTNAFGDKTYFITTEIVEQINNWYRGKAYMYDNNMVDDDELETLIHTIEKVICRYGVKLVCIDNLMTAMDVGVNDDYYRAQSEFVKQLKRLAVKHDVAIILVAHPRKTNAPIDNDDISGSGDITNRVDVVMAYSRNAKKQEDGPECDSLLSIMKNRLTGKLTRKNEPIELYYSNKSKRITSKDSFVDGPKMYGWTKTGTVDYSDFEEI